LSRAKGLLYHLEEIIKSENKTLLGLNQKIFATMNSLYFELSTTQLVPTTQPVIAIREIKKIMMSATNRKKACDIGGRLKELIPLIHVRE